MKKAEMISVEVPEDVVFAGGDAISIYLDAIENGTAPRMAEMFALRQAPRLMTDSVFMEGVKPLGDCHDKMHLRDILRGARKHGFRPNQNDLYMPTLARFPGDPEAFVSHSGGRYYVKKLLEKRGAGGEGAVKVKSREPDEAPKRKHRLAPDLLNRAVANLRRDNHELRDAPVEELKQIALDTHAPE